MTVQDLLAALQRLPRDAELLAVEPGCEEYCEREIDEVEWQGGRAYLAASLRWASCHAGRLRPACRPPAGRSADPLALLPHRDRTACLASAEAAIATCLLKAVAGVFLGSC
jgi:hypothetical protein